MKKILILAVLAIMAVGSANAQTKVYCEIHATQLPLKKSVTIQIDFGQKVKAFQADGLVDENGKALVFNSTIDAINHMASLGWEVEQTYAVTLGQQNVYHYLLSKVVAEGESAMEGLKTHLQHKAETKNAE